jgi:hypothetical protein
MKMKMFTATALIAVALGGNNANAFEVHDIIEFGPSGVPACLDIEDTH